MNETQALSMRRDLNVIIDAYEEFLYDEVETGGASISASEALVTRDLVRTIAMSETSLKRAERASGGQSSVDPKDQSNLGTSEQSLAEEAGLIGSATSPAVVTPKDKTSDELFRDLEECIPCAGIWDWQDIDWTALKQLLTFDLMSRFHWLTRIDDYFKGNPILEDLCRFLNAFRDLCPQDLLRLIAIITAYITKTLGSIKFNLVSAFKDILGAILRPYISGLEDFLNFYIQYLVDQIECILNAIETSARALEDLNISNKLGPDAIHFKKELTSDSADEFFQDTQKLTKQTRRFLRQGTKDIVHDITNDIPIYLKSLTEDTLDWAESQLQRLQDAMIDFLGGEWLFTNQNISWYEQVRNAATLVRVLQVIADLGNLDELCSEDNIKKVVLGVNDSPDGTLLTLTDSGRDIPVLLDSGSDDSLSEATPAASSSDSPTNTVPFSLSDCLNKLSPSEEEQVRQWIEELS